MLVARAVHPTLLEGARASQTIPASRVKSARNRNADVRNVRQVARERKDVVEALIYAVLLSLMTSRRLVRVLTVGDRKARMTAGSWWKLLSMCAQEILLRLVQPARVAASITCNLVRTPLHELQDPQCDRCPFLQDASSFSAAMDGRKCTRTKYLYPYPMRGSSAPERNEFQAVEPGVLRGHPGDQRPPEGRSTASACWRQTHSRFPLFVR